MSFNSSTVKSRGLPWNIYCETDICDAMDYAHWIGELGFHHGYIEEISTEIMKHKQ